MGTEMEKIYEQALLYDFYGELPTSHQRQIFEDVVLNDYSFSEIAKDQGISRQGVHDMIKRCNKLLEGYEQKLHLVEKFLKAKELADEIHRQATQFSIDNDGIHVQEIALLSKQMMEEW